MLMLFKSPQDFFLASFISGLRQEIKTLVLALEPKDLQTAISLARHQESVVEAIAKRVSSELYKPYSDPEFAPVRLLTGAEMTARWERNLCYNCDEVYTPAHRCKNPQAYMLMTEEEEAAYYAEMGYGEEDLWGNPCKN
ncbi:UNVERIFIED_CONTAM: hypothetical protein Sradi_1098700 [Sesamum radiatum]|uniref:Uncharacterized protein n=1 Tax=Sesamum radiatum TaxID=300843 RepID=A0AAW2V9H0_SESRA